MAVASAMLALVVGTAFAVLVSSVMQLRDAQQRASRSEAVLVAANLLERLVVDAETGLRGFVITGDEEFLQPWRNARDAFPAQAAALERLVADNPSQQARAREITHAGRSYLDDYSVPLVDTARTDPAAARTVAATAEGKRRVDAIRAQFDRFLETEAGLATAREQATQAAANRAILAAVVGLAGSVVLVAGFAGYLAGAIVRPVRRAAAMAGRIAAGDLDARLPERGIGEIGVLERSFNTMAGSLQHSRAELAASRARIVTAADQARRRIERDLHDGVQQRLVSLVLDLRAIEAETGSPAGRVGQVGQVADGLTAALDDLRELSRGIHPAILSEGGLGPALRSLARRSPVPVELHVNVPGRLPPPVEVAAYYLVSEALANAAKHARASAVHVEAHTDGARLHLAVRDDGTGGADPSRGSGLVGLTDRIEALGGTLAITSRPGEGTALVADLPLTGSPEYRPAPSEDGR